MRSFGRWPTARSWPAAIFVAWAVAVWAAPCHAAGPNDLCAVASAAGAFTADPAATTALEKVATAVEQRLSAEVAPQGDDEIAKLTATLNVAETGRPSTAALGIYCAAAGELARRGWVQSALPAESELRVGFEDAESAGDKAVAARAAYRLSLAQVTYSQDAGSEAQRGVLTGAVGMVATDLLDPRSGQAACDAISAPGGPGRVGGVTPALDLKCSTALADAAGDVQQAAIANLTYAHDLLAMSDTTSGSAADSRQLAGVAALHSLQPLAASSSGMSSELAGRLIETAIDAGEAGDPRLEPAIEAMKAGQPDDPAVQAYAAALSGRIAQAAGQPDIARRWFEQAIYLEGQRAAPLRLSDWYMLLAAVDPKRHDSDVLSAYAALQSVRPLLPLREPFTEESTFELHMRGVFKAAVDVTLTNGGDADSVAQIGLAQQIVESYRQAEFESLFGSQCVPPSHPYPTRATAQRGGNPLPNPAR